MSKTKETEVWKSLDFLEYPDYEVSTLGKFKSLKYGKERILKPRKNNKEYLYVDLSENGKRKNFRVHYLIALAFLENPYNLPQINHKNEIKSDNRVENLEWCTAKQNVNYGTRNERVSKKMSELMKGKYIGENHPMYGKHRSEETKQKISKANKGKISLKRKPTLQFSLDNVFIREWDSATTASKELKIHQQHICQCCNGKRKTCGGYIWRYKD